MRDTADIVVDLIEVEAPSIQAFLDALATIFASHNVRSASLYSPALNDLQTLELIATTAIGMPPRLSRQKEEREATVFLCVYDSFDRQLFLTMYAEQPIPLNAALRKVLSQRLKEIIYLKKQQIRLAVIEQSIRAKDVNSFLYRLVRSLRNSFIYCDEITIFLEEASGTKIALSATTSQLRGLEKKSVYYTAASVSPVITCFSTNSPLVEDAHSHFAKDEFDSNFAPLRLHGRGFWPISLAASDFQIFRGANIKALGVLRVSNPRRRHGDRTWPSHFSQYDHIVISFVSEVLFVLLQQYVQFMTTETDTARLIHGLGANLDAALKFAETVKEFLFIEPVAHEAGTDQEVRTAVEARFRLLREIGYTEHQVYLMMKDLEYFLGDLSYQFGKVQGTHTYEAESIPKLHSDVLMPAVRLIPGIAAVNSRPAPRVGNLVSRGSLTLPPVRANRQGLIMVLRNLFENSVKYNKSQDPQIELAFTVLDDTVVIDYYDNGIGVEDGETEQIFMEGYRSVAARRTSNRGIGVGLSFSREVIQSFGGSVVCLSQNNGAHFQIKLKRSK